MSLCRNQHPDIRNKQALDFIQEIILKKVSIKRAETLLRVYVCVVCVSDVTAGFITVFGSSECLRSKEFL